MERKVKNFKEIYQGNLGDESLLALFNDELADAHKALLNLSVQNQINIHVIGAPRSGTSLVTQYLISALELAYPSNLFAAFYKAPLFGVEFAKRFLQDFRVSTFKSYYGRTLEPWEPHEFGYFWKLHLNYDDLQGKPNSHEELIDWKNLNLLLNNISSSFGTAVVYKSFLLGFHAERMVKENPNTIFIYIQRDVVENALSLLKFREEVYGSIEEWVSIKPRMFCSIKKSSVYEQVVQQVIMLNQDYSQELKNMSNKNVIKVRYEDFCQSPDVLLREIESRFSQMSKTVNRRKVKLPEGFTSVSSKSEYRDEVEAAYFKVKCK